MKPTRSELHDHLCRIAQAAGLLLQPYGDEIQRWRDAGLPLDEARRVALGDDLWAYRALRHLETAFSCVLSELEDEEGVDVLRRMGWQG